MTGIRFDPLQLRPGTSTTKPYWELSSDMTLPPLSSKCSLWSNENKPFNGDYDKGCFIREGLYSNPELHYERSALVSLSQFDIAQTHERFGNGAMVAYPKLVCSKRFYELCSQHEWEFEWQPVRIDPD